MNGSLRVIDFGTVTPLRSQTLWHAIAYGVSAGSPPTLSFMRPSAPYVSIGFHTPFEAVDHDRCTRLGIPVYRRMVGGGPVYLDPDQLFFQITVPEETTPALRPAAVQWLLEPAVAAFRAVGIDADLDDRNEVVVGDRKVCGHAAGQIGTAVIVVGNLITRFDHDRAAAVVRTPAPDAAAEFRRLVHRYVAPTPADFDMFENAAALSYAEALDLPIDHAGLTGEEEKRLIELDGAFTRSDWVGEGPVRRTGAPWRVKVKSGVWVYASDAGATRVVVSAVHGTVDRVHLIDPELDGSRARAEAEVRGMPLERAADHLRHYGPSGRRLATELERLTGKGPT
jgi:lipoate-protein ligase A